jgi:hypothetical protein
LERPAQAQDECFSAQEQADSAATLALLLGLKLAGHWLAAR